jgi:hypothetical protein
MDRRRIGCMVDMLFLLFWLFIAYAAWHYLVK